MNYRDEPAQPAQDSDRWFLGLSRYEQAEITFTAAWIVALGRRYDELTDADIKRKAGRLGHEQARLMFPL
jgi:hypothetical protein